MDALKQEVLIKMVHLVQKHLLITNLYLCKVCYLRDVFIVLCCLIEEKKWKTNNGDKLYSYMQKQVNIISALSS